jgi:hypothetical protein
MKLKWMSFVVCLVLGTQSGFSAGGLLKLKEVDSFAGNSCWFDSSPPKTVFGSFTLPGVTGAGTLLSSMFFALQVPMFGGDQGPIYTYALDMSQMSVPAGHCVKLAVYFGSPASLCTDNQVLVLTNATSIPLLAATQNLSTIYFTYGTDAGPCLTPGQTGARFAMKTQQEPTTNYVTVIDDYVDPFTGLSNHYTTKVTALVPDIPPLTVVALPPFFQGLLKTQAGTVATNGQYDIIMQLLDAPTNGVPVSETITSSVNVVNGLINAPMDFDPSGFFGQQRWLSLAVQLREAANQPPSLIPALPISPTPQALYAYTAGTVGRISPGQAVTRLNGLTDAVTLEAGSGIVISGNGNTLTIAALPGGPSDRNLKTDLAAINPAEVLARLETLPVQSWRFTDELPGIRHVGPMAQDFMSAFHLGDDEKLIGYLDEGGVALAAIQGLNQKFEQKNGEIADLKHELEKLKQLVDKLGNAKD